MDLALKIPPWMREIDPPLKNQLPSPAELRAMSDEQIREFIESLTRNEVTGLMWARFLDEARSSLVEECLGHSSVQDVRDGFATPGNLGGDEVAESALYELSVDVDYLAWWNRFSRNNGNAALRQWALAFAATALDSTRTFEPAEWEPPLVSMLTHLGGDEFLGLVQGSYAFIEHVMYRSRENYAAAFKVEGGLIPPSVSFGVCSVHEAVYLNRILCAEHPELALDYGSRDYITRILTIMRAIAGGREKWSKRHGRILQIADLRANNTAVYDATIQDLRKGANVSDQTIAHIANRLDPRKWDEYVRKIVNDDLRSKRLAASERARRLAGLPLQPASDGLDPRIDELVHLAVLYEGPCTEDEMFIDH